jgi:GT2 family glycosyltransferase
VISFVLPTRNRPEELARTIERLGALEPCVTAEVIVVDNHSKEPATVPARLANGWRACTLRRPRNEGAAARNDGVRIASGPWIVMLDDDSYPLDMRFVEALREAPADVAAIGAEVLLASGEHEQGGMPEVIVGCGAAIRREAYVAAGGYDHAFHFYVEEYDLCAKLLARGHRVTHDSRFRVLHAKTATNRDMGLVLGRLVRNNGWVLRRYCPEALYDAAMREILERYEAIATKEGVLDGYRAGLAELEATIANERRTPMSDALWQRFTGETAARPILERHRALIAGRRVALVSEGKAGPLLARLVTELGGIPSPERDAETLVVGTLSPGPVLDAIAARGHETRPVIVAWSMRDAANGLVHELRRAG